MVLNRIPLVIVLSFFLSDVFSQDIANYYPYQINQFNAIAAFAGNEEKVVASLNSRTQYAGVKDGPKNLVFGLHAPIFENQGAGLRFINDTRGLFDVNKIDGIYTHRFFVKDDVYFRFGLNVGLVNRRINTGRIDKNSSIDLNDASLSSNTFNTNRFASGFSMLSKIKDLKVGFAIPNLVENGVSMNSYMVGMLFYDYKINNDWKLTPWMSYQNIPVLKNVADVSAKIEWKKMIMAQVTYSNIKSVKGAVGFDLKGFGMSYMYEHYTGALTNLASSSHELAVIISFDRKTRNFKTAKYEKDLDVLISYMANLTNDKNDYDKGFIQSEIAKIRQELQKLMEVNSDKTSAKVERKLDVIEEHINNLIQKYSLDK